MDSSSPFYQQLTSRFVALITLFTLSILVVIYLLEYREQQLTQWQEQHFPLIERVYHQQVLLNKSSQLIEKITKSTELNELLENHHLLIEQLEQIKSFATNNRRELERIIFEQNNHTEEIQRLSENEHRNKLLLQSGKIQLQLVLDALALKLTDEQEKQAKLYQQIAEDKVADKVTASRAKALATITQSQELTKQTYNAINDVYHLFNRVQLTYPLIEFDLLTANLSTALALWQERIDDVDNANEADKKLLTLLAELEHLLLTKQSAMAKWRGHIRVAQEYFQVLNGVKLQLMQRAEALSLPTVEIQYIPDFITDNIPNNVTIQIEQFKIAAYVLLGLLMLSFIMVLIRLREKIKQHDHDNLLLVNNTISGQAIESSVDSFEQAEMAKRLSDIVKPEHSEADYQALRHEVSTLHQMLFQHANIATFTSEKSADNRQVSEQSDQNTFAQQLIFNDDKTNQHWRHGFTHEQARLIINAARKAKDHQQAQQCEVTTLSQQHLLITVWHDNALWQGMVVNHATEQHLSEKLDALEEKLAQQNQAHQSSLAANAEHLSKMLIRTMLQSQSASIGSGVTSTQVYRQLSRIFDWCRQLQINTTLRTKAKVNAMADVLLNDELAALSHNILHEAYTQRNKVIVRFDKQQLTHGRVNIRLLHRTLMGLAKMCLQELFKSNLIFATKVIDKNAGQQIIRFSFEVHSSQIKNTIPENIQALVNYTDEVDHPHSFNLLRYMHALIQAMHGTNLQVKELQNGFELTLDMPIALAEAEQVVEQNNIDLKDANIVIFSDKSNLSAQLSETISAINGQVETIEKTEHLLEMLNVHHLTKRHLAAILLSPECYKASYYELTQHLHHIPKPLQPKLMVLQSHFNPRLHREGFFAHSDSFIENKNFAQQLSTFIQSEQHTNMLISKEIFAHYHFEQTQVEVLIAVHHPEQHAQLARLLYWLGLQAHFVCQSQVMLKHWQSGRYLVLITELDVAPFINMQVGKNVSRGVFTFDQSLLTNYQEKRPKHAQNWQLATLPKLIDIQALVKLFTPWLKEKHLLTSEKKAPASKAKIIPTQPLVAEQVNQESEIHVESLSKVAPSFDGLPQAFDLEKFAANQGSPELAVFMLDDYLADINQAIANIETSLINKDFKQAKINNEVLLKTSLILAADELTQLSQQLSALLKKKSPANANSLIKQIAHSNSQLIKFAKAI